MAELAGPESLPGWCCTRTLAGGGGGRRRKRSPFLGALQEVVERCPRQCGIVLSPGQCRLAEEGSAQPSLLSADPLFAGERKRGREKGKE